MAYKSEDEVRERALLYCKALQKSGFDANLLPSTFRDYHVKVSVRQEAHSYGNLIVYHKPSKGSFTLGTHELKEKSAVPALEKVWALLDHPAPSAPAPPEVPASPAGNPVSLAEEPLVLYVDGSFINNKIGYGLVVVQGDQVIHEESGSVEASNLQGMNQVGGEIQAVYAALDWCEQNDVKGVTIAYDYKGLEMWATGQWNASTPATRVYAAHIRELSIQVRWQKIESHTGDRWNERADQLAKQGAQFPQQTDVAEPDPQALLEQKAPLFVDYLRQHGIESSYEGVKNDQFARFTFGSQKGYLDLYNTRKRSPSEPYLHAFHDHDFENQIEKHWQQFWGGDSTGSTALRASVLHTAAHYYHLLKPYQDCDFDFICLATALHQAAQMIGKAEMNAKENRYNFAALEELYFTLKQGEGQEQQ